MGGEIYFGLLAGDVSVQHRGSVRMLSGELKGALADRVGLGSVRSLCVLRCGEVFGDEIVTVGGESADCRLVIRVGLAACDLIVTPWGEKAVVDNEVSTRTNTGAQGTHGVLQIPKDGSDGDQQGDIEQVARPKPTAHIPTMELASMAKASLLGMSSALFDERWEGVYGDDVEAEPFGQREGDHTLAAAEVEDAGGGRQSQGLQKPEHFVGERGCPVGQQFGKKREQIGRRIQGLGNLSVDVLVHSALRMARRPDNEVPHAASIAEKSPIQKNETLGASAAGGWDNLAQHGQT